MIDGQLSEAEMASAVSRELTAKSLKVTLILQKVEAIRQGVTAISPKVTSICQRVRAVSPREELWQMPLMTFHLFIRRIRCRY